jgi:hypothetical protein
MTGPHSAAFTTAADLMLQLNEDELRQLSRLVYERLQLVAQARSTVMLSQFRCGSRVTFLDKVGLRKYGVITRLNKKTASILTDDQQRWKVHPSLLALVVGGEENHGKIGQ